MRVDNRRSVRGSRPNYAAWLTLGALALLGSAVLPAGCSGGDTGGSGASDDGGPGADAPARAPPGGDDDAVPDAGDCRAACDAAHPGAVALDRAIVACWQASCATPCLDPDAGAGAPDAGADASDAGDAGLACARPVATGAAACDRCTVASCCKAWDECFGDAECSSLEACYRACS